MDWTAINFENFQISSLIYFYQYKEIKHFSQLFVCLFKQTPLGIKADSKLAINQAKDGTKPNSEASLTDKGVQKNKQITFPI